jgi:hypothetical protein
MMKHLVLSICFLMVCCFFLHAQSSRESEEKIIDDIMERLIENNEEGVDYTDIQDQLEYAMHHKLNLNKVTREDLQRLIFLDNKAIEAIIRHKEHYGDFMTIYELQTIEELEERMIYYLSYFVEVDPVMLGDRTPLFKMLSRGKHEFIHLHENHFQDKAGYYPSRKREGKSYYLGSANREVFRYRFTYSNVLSFGYTGEKDMGEQFFSGTQQYGFDFNSFHFVLRNQKHVKAIALGDYQASFGQGLTFGSGMAARKSAYVLNVRRNVQTIRPYRSVNENEFLRGAAFTYQLGNMEITGISSFNAISTNYQEPDSIPAEEASFSSVQLTGLHRTEAENKSRYNVLQGIYGGHLSWRKEKYMVGLTAIHTFYDHTFQRGSKPYQYYHFEGQSLSNFGTDYQFSIRNLNVFGELSYSSNGALAGILGFIIPLHPRFDIACVYRNYAANYQPIFNSPFGENSDGRNEEGMYTGMSFKFNHRWIWNSYFDFYHSSWLRYLTDAPSKGYDYLSEVQYNPSKTTQFYIRYRHEIKAKNLPDNPAVSDYLANVSRDIIRLHVQYKWSPLISGKTRLESVHYYDEQNGDRSGTLIFQDISYTSERKKLTLTGRVALFSVEDYNARVYANENDVLYQYAIPQYQNSGIRYYIVMHCKLFRHLDTWLKYSQTTYNNVDKISSGLEQVDGNTLSDLRVQCRWSF